jgi:chemotaxis protein MotB
MESTTEAQHPTAAQRGADTRVFGGDQLIDDDTLRSNWAVPWSDLMMTMFVLFAALLAAQTFHAREQHRKQHLREVELQKQLVEREKPLDKIVPAPQPPEPVTKPITVPEADKSLEPLTKINVLAQSNDAVRESNLQNVEVALLDDQSVKVSVQGPMFFARGKADLKPEVMNFLDRLAIIMSRTPYDIHIVGHTDGSKISSGPYPSNWELSLARASHVARYLIDAGGLDPARFMIMGRGEYDPVADNDDERSRALNRRVEIIITRDIGKEEHRQ